MGLQVGIIGLPNVGKSTTFNALTSGQNAASANYPFCTIEPNTAVVTLKDPRVDAIAALIKPKRVLYSTLEFVDIAGLVKGASNGEGLGNKFLANIKETDALLHIVRCFDSSDITHVEDRIDPVSDVEIINIELLLADIATLEKRVQKLERQAKSDKSATKPLASAKALLSHMEAGGLASSFVDKDSEEFKELDNELRFLTNKKVIYVANVDEDALKEDNLYVVSLKKHVENKCKDGDTTPPVVKICSKIEEELVSLPPEEKAEYLDELGIKESGLDTIVRLGFNMLGLISYFTAGEQEVRAWTIHDGWKAPRAASVIHNDFEKGFIKAETIGYEDFIKAGSEAKAKELGLLRIEGKDYVVKDGDVMHFRFNV